ncbi:hypothetical protein HPB50_006112 [Hyalomma asiaticum]|uniref:Uncharacterized protein n=1 Tax=Hyalomma asiaticum TaxID=266040 RepID=A0ACB7SJZ4_HYAAI|nr:hypothetical protein HPB50_006112 [Hyalomma asiaticum]
MEPWMYREQAERDRVKIVRMVWLEAAKALATSASYCVGFKREAVDVVTLGDHSGREVTRGGTTRYIYTGDAGAIGVARLKGSSTRLPASGVLFGVHVTRERLHPFRHRRGRDRVIDCVKADPTSHCGTPCLV